MRNTPSFCFYARLMTLCVLLLSACTSSDSVDLFPRRGEYDYEPPVVRPQATPVPEESPEEVEESGSGEKRGFFSFLSRKKDKDDEPTEDPEHEADAEEPDPDRPEPEQSANEDEPVAVEPKTAQDVDAVYRLKTGDQVFITLSGSGGLNEQIETLIDEEGGVKLRFIGSVAAAGKTPSEFEREIEAEYTERQKIYKEVVARVVVPNTFYFIGGEVRQPGRFQLVGRVTLSQAIPSAGNFTEWANDRKIILARGDDRFVINFREIADDPTKDIELQPGDVITVERRSFL